MSRPLPPGPWVALLLLLPVALLVPSSLVLSGPLHSNGWVGRLLVFWIAIAVVLGWTVQRRPRLTTPVETGSWLFLIGLASALAATGMRELTALESAGALRFALILIPLTILTIGVASLSDRRTSDLLLAGALIGAAGSALVALAQFVTPFEWDQVLRFPGLTTGVETGSGSRGGFVRVRGAAGHPIEFGVISGAVVPIGLHLARFSTTGRRRVLAGAMTLVILVSIPMSVSRSGVLVAALAVGLYAVTLSFRQQVTALVVAVAGLAVFRAAIPGLLGTVRSIFLGAPNDDSITGRTDDYSAVFTLWENQPVLGYGLGTFRPEEYFFLDNQYLMALVEGGVVLLLATVAWFVLGIASARGAYRRAVDEKSRSRAQAVLAALAAIAVSGAFFDLFSFHQVTVLVFVLAGVAGALWRDAVAHGKPLPSPAERLGITASTSV